MGLFSAFAVPSVKADEALTLVDQGATLLDVREKSEWNAGHAPQALHVPLANLASAPKRLKKGRKVVVVCRSGNRSRSATNALIQAGYEAVNLSGGMRAWQAAGGSVRDRNNRPGTVI